MTVNFKKEHLAAMIPTNKDVDAWYDAMMDLFPKYKINTPNRIAGFIAQCAHESADFTRLEENLNYSEKALNSVFGRYFGPGKRDAAEYARKPEKIANYVYMDEYRSAAGALGNTKTGDGWKFRGRGLKQLTGRNNYAAFGKSVGMTADEAAAYVATEKGAIESACWFWDRKNLNEVADAGDIVRMTKIINGGDIGLVDRKKRWEKALAILGGRVDVSKSEASSESDDKVLTVGSRGEAVKRLQKALRLSADGVFGPGTKRAVKEFQAKNGLTPDGVAGPATLRKLHGE